jgi:prepilin-type N-terminal cleavage/methylation domain-containing protein
MKKLSGFTLIELIVVVSVIAVLAGIITPAIGSIVDDARDSRSIAECKHLATAILQYEKQYGWLPYSGLPGGSATYSYAYNNQSQTNTLNTLIRTFLGRRAVMDPWSTPYMMHQYAFYNPPARAIICTWGKDKANQGEWSGSVWQNRSDINFGAGESGYYFVFK